jgi:L-alanine-DL-glutamate epimerase-like enolase superfamily enzyme
MKITDLKCAVIGNNPVVRIVTDEGIDGYGQGESSKPYLKPFVMHFRDQIFGADPTDIERTMLRIRQRGSFKPYGTAVSMIEMALWDLTGKAAGLPVHKLLGGKVRDKVETYNGNIRFKLADNTPESYAENMKKMKERPEGFRLIKQGIGFHSPMKYQEGFYFGTPQEKLSHGLLDRGMLTERGLNHIVDCVEAMKAVLGDEVALALDCGPGFTVPDAIRLARRLEHLHIAWLEDMLTGDYVPYVLADVYRDLTHSTSTPIHTGEQIYLRQNFKELIERHAVNVVGPDPCDVGGIAELKWIAEYADLHGILMAPHGTANGLLGLGALINVCATLPANFIAFEYPTATEPWWEEIVVGLPEQIVRDSMVDLLPGPGLGLDIDPDGARKYLAEGDEGFFDRV